MEWGLGLGLREENGVVLDIHPTDIGRLHLVGTVIGDMESIAITQDHEEQEEDKTQTAKDETEDGYIF